MKYEVKFVQNVCLTDVERIINLEDQGWMAYEISPYNTMMGTVYKWEEIETDSINTYIESFNSLFLGENIHIGGYEKQEGMSQEKAREFLTQVLEEIGVAAR